MLNFIRTDKNSVAKPFIKSAEKEERRDGHLAPGLTLTDFYTIIFFLILP